MSVYISVLLLVFIIILVLVTNSSISASPTTTTCPPSGYDTYDSQPIWAGAIPTEASALQQAEILSGYARSNGGNFKTLILDEGWADYREANESYIWFLNENGIPVPIPQNFPSSANGQGLKLFAQTLRDKYQMKLGVWHIKGVPRAAVEQKLPIAGTTNCSCDMILTADKKSCSWHKDVYDVDASTFCGQAYYNSVIDLWVSWGITYFKIDCIFGSDLRMTEIQAYSAAIQRAQSKYNVDVTFSVSPGFLATRETFAPLQQTGVNLARVTDDLWDCWSATLLPAPECLISNVGATIWTLAYFQPYLNGKNMFNQYLRPDPDMIPVAKIKLLYSRMSRLTGKMLNFVFGLFAITKSPMILGGNLTAINNATNELPELRNLLSNPDLKDLHCNGEDPSWIYAENVTKYGNSTDKGEIVWKLPNGMNRGFQVYLGYFPFDPFSKHEEDVNATSRQITWADIGLDTMINKNKNKNQNKNILHNFVGNFTIPSVTAYDVLNRKVLQTYNPHVVDGFTMTTELNNAAVWLMDLHE